MQLIQTSFAHKASMMGPLLRQQRGQLSSALPLLLCACFACPQLGTASAAATDSNPQLLFPPALLAEENLAGKANLVPQVA